MSELFYAWSAFAVLAFIVEMFSGTLYGLSFSLSGVVVAIYVLITGEKDLSIVQALLFAVTGTALCFVFPKIFKTRTEFKQGLDAHVGKKFVLKKVGEDFKIAIDGVDYLVDDACVTERFAPKAKVVFKSHDSGIITVSLVEKS